MNIVLKSATVYHASNPQIHKRKFDIHIKDGIVQKMAATMVVPSGATPLEFQNLHVSSGWFDSSVSFGEPGYEERETLENGLATAAKSGFTDIVLNTNTNPKPDTGADIVFFKERSKGRTCSMHAMGCLTRNSEGKSLAELYDMHKAGAVAFSDYKTTTANANLLKIGLQYAQNFNGLILSYPEDGQIAPAGVMNEGTVSTRLGMKGLPNLAEELRLIRDLYLLEYTGGKLHIPTISTAKSVELIGKAKKSGLDVTCSVALHQLFLTEEEVESFNTDAKLKPPLRTKEDQNALIEGVKNGSIDFVTADHAPIAIEEKKKTFDLAQYGTIGLESAFGGLNKLFPLEQSITLLTRGRPRFCLDQPELKEGEKACFTLFNPEGEYLFSEKHILSRSKNSVFLGKSLQGSVYGTINNGSITLS